MYANCNWASIPGPLFLKRGGVGIEAQLQFIFDIEAVLLTQFDIEMFKKNNFCNFQSVLSQKMQKLFFLHLLSRFFVPCGSFACCSSF